MKVLKSLASIQAQYEAVVREIESLKVKQNALKKAGIDYGTPNYKQGRYLRIVRPATDERGRQFEYIGADPEKQQVVLSAIERGKEYDELDGRLVSLEKALRRLDDDLYHLTNTFKWSHGLAIEDTTL
ncbi:hypothetical protein B9Q17_10005 [Marinobacter vinifirmus]|uniref:Uncharacterized protein n=1 Tax=Marinobacter vinifirmus TaxID=355591 RepID=A0A7Z1DRC7_9GAMM|nr:hypothetical protein [Marinobacter vinifirmus]OZC34590.1 hypothetical protein B9Q17_10005 [Marinobacter vinifirmus]